MQAAMESEQQDQDSTAKSTTPAPNRAGAASSAGSTGVPIVVPGTPVTYNTLHERMAFDGLLRSMAAVGNAAW
jgi:hypothetical protein